MKVLVLRFSALGDIALSVNLLKTLEDNYPQHDFIFISKPFTAPLFQGLRTEFKGVNLDNYKGLFGIIKLSRELKNTYKPDAIVDLHDVIRSQVIRNYFKLSGTKVGIIDKGRKEKKLLVQKENKHKVQLKHSALRYLDAFRQIGLEVDFKVEAASRIEYPISESPASENPKIGFAPLAMHQAKMWPKEKAIDLIKRLNQMNYQVYLFGGPNEFEKLQEFSGDQKNIEVVAGKYGLDKEIGFMSQLDAFIAMDSSNMHFASLANTPVISIWGATHRYAGFYALGANKDYEVEDKDLECRPCSVFGNKECWRGDYACLNNISVEFVLQKLKLALEREQK